MQKKKDAGLGFEHGKDRQNVYPHPHVCVRIHVGVRVGSALLFVCACWLCVGK